MAVQRTRSHRRRRCYLCQSLPTLASKGLRTSAPWNVNRLEMSLPPCCSVWTFTVQSPKLSSFSSPGSTYRCPFTEPFDGFRSTFGQSSGFTTDSPAPQSTVISRYRPRLPTVSTGYLSIDMSPIGTVFRSTSSGHHSPSLECSLGRNSIGTSSGRPSHWRRHTEELQIGKCWYTPNF